MSREPMIVPTGAFVGVDLGQAHDPTAIAIVRRFEHQTHAPHRVGSPEWRRGSAPRVANREVRFTLGHLERLPLNTTYPDVVRHVKAIMAAPQLRSAGERQDIPLIGIEGHRFGMMSNAVPATGPDLVIDATGVGRPVLDMMRAEGLEPIGITITGGDRATNEGGMWRVPKRELVSVLQVLLQTERLAVSPALPLAHTFTSELLAFKVKIDPLTAHDSYGAWRDGEHDDLVLAAAIACWYGMRGGTQSSVASIDQYRIARIR